MPESENHERDTVFTVIGVTALSTIAMIVYPLVIAFFHLDHAAIGVFLGGTIHDVAQVVGAGFSVSDETGNVATFTKLLRVAMLLPVVVALVVCLSRAQHYRSRAAIAGFPCRLRDSSGGQQLGHHSGARARRPQGYFPVVPRRPRLRRLAMKTSLKAMAEVGGRAIGLIVAETVFLAVLVLAIVLWKF